MTVDRSDFYFEAANSLNLRNPEDSTRPLACHPVGAVVAVLALAGCGVFAFAPVLMLMASQVGWLFPEDSQRE